LIDIQTKLREFKIATTAAGTGSNYMFPVKPDFNNHINAIFEKNDRFTFGL